MGLRAYLIGGIAAIVIALAGANFWLFNARASLIEQRAELRRQLAVSAEVLAQERAARTIADDTATAETRRARAAEKQIRLILNGCGLAQPITDGGNDDATCEGDCDSDPIRRALDWLRDQQG